MGHTGGDLSLPEEVRDQIMPNPFPVAEGAKDWMARVDEAEKADKADADADERGEQGG